MIINLVFTNNRLFYYSLVKFILCNLLYSIVDICHIKYSKTIDDSNDLGQVEDFNFEAKDIL